MTLFHLPVNYYVFRRLPAMTLSHLASPKGNERQTILDTADSVSPAALQRNTRNDTYQLTWTDLLLSKAAIIQFMFVNFVIFKIIFYYSVLEYLLVSILSSAENILLIIYQRIVLVHLSIIEIIRIIAEALACSLYSKMEAQSEACTGELFAGSWEPKETSLQGWMDLVTSYPRHATLISDKNSGTFSFCPCVDSL